MNSVSLHDDNNGVGDGSYHFIDNFSTRHDYHFCNSYFSLFYSFNNDDDDDDDDDFNNNNDDDEDDDDDDDDDGF